MIGIKFDRAIRPLVLIIPKISVKTFKIKGDNKLMSFSIDNEKLLEKYKAIWTKIENIKNIELGYNDRYIKAKIKTFGDKVYSNFRSFNVPEDDIECESFTVISIDSLLVHEKKYYLQLYLENCAYKIPNNKRQIIFRKIFLKNRYYKCCITKELT